MQRLWRSWSCLLMSRDRIKIHKWRKHKRDSFHVDSVLIPVHWVNVDLYENWVTLTLSCGSGWMGNKDAFSLVLNSSVRRLTYVTAVPRLPGTHWCSSRFQLLSESGWVLIHRLISVLIFTAARFPKHGRGEEVGLQEDVSFGKSAEPSAVQTWFISRYLSS